jgi:hypothetical protein
MSEQFELLRPNESDAREMQIFSSIPEGDQQAWLHFVHSSHEKEKMGIGPAHTFDQFENGLAPAFVGTLPVFDTLVKTGLGDSPLATNFEEPEVIKYKGEDFKIEPALDSFKPIRGLLEYEMERGPLAIVAPHASLATPYAIGRCLLETIGHDKAKNVYIVVGPRPTVMQFEHFNQETGEIVVIRPIDMGRAIANILLTGPNTDSTRNNPAFSEWLSELKVKFKTNLDEIIEAKDGENPIIIYCPAGRVAEEKKVGHIREFRVDGKFDYLTKYPNLRVLPVGAYDRLLVNPERPSSIVFINPDKNAWPIKNEAEAQWVHERSVHLSQSPVGGLEMERVSAQSMRLARQRVRKSFGKQAAAPYLSD